MHDRDCSLMIVSARACSLIRSYWLLPFVIFGIIKGDERADNASVKKAESNYRFIIHCVANKFKHDIHSVVTASI